MLKELLREREYLSVTKMNDGTEATAENWQERRKEMLELLQKYSYGRTPDVEVSVSAEAKLAPGKVWGNKYYGMYTCAGKCREQFFDLTYKTKYGEGVIPFQIFTPRNVECPPVILHLGFGEAPHKYIPVEEIIDNGYALVVVDYRKMVNDNKHGDYSDGIAAHFGTKQPREGEEWGKIGMWAWGASRVMDYLVAERPDLNTKQTAVIGHSRLGKTALWCGAQDERFAAVISNNSGYGGASSSKHGTGERVTSFVDHGSWDWFCENFKKFQGELEDAKPYDQSFVLALVAPRYLLVGSAEDDKGADPRSEFLTTLHASSAWERLGKTGLVTEDRLAVPGDWFGEGNVLYHYRKGKHYLSRDDWAAYIRFLDQKFKKA